MKLFEGAMCELRCGGKIGPIELLTNSMIGFDRFMWYSDGNYLMKKETAFDIVEVLNPQDAPKVLLSEVEPKVGMVIAHIDGGTVQFEILAVHEKALLLWNRNIECVSYITPGNHKYFEVVE